MDHRPMRRIVHLMVVVLALPAAAGAGSVFSNSYISPDGREVGLVFDDGTGLAARAVFSLAPAGQTLSIALANTSYAVPAVGHFDNPADQLLTSLYFDLGGPGLGPGDPRVIGGAAYIADDAYGQFRKRPLLPGGMDISWYWGHGNFQYGDPQAFLPPNFVSAMQAHTKPFKGTRSLNGPDWGALSEANLEDALTSARYAMIVDTVRFELLLDTVIPDLRSLVAPGNMIPYVEFGSDYEFFVADDPPPLVPEPVTLAGMGGALVALAGYVRRRVRRRGSRAGAGR